MGSGVGSIFLALEGPARNGTIVFVAKKIADKIGADTLYRG